MFSQKIRKEVAQRNEKSMNDSEVKLREQLWKAAMRCYWPIKSISFVADCGMVLKGETDRNKRMQFMREQIVFLQSWAQEEGERYAKAQGHPPTFVS